MHPTWKGCLMKWFIWNEDKVFNKQTKQLPFMWSFCCDVWGIVIELLNFDSLYIWELALMHKEH